MARFEGRAREQVERIMTYLAAPGACALVDLATGRVELLCATPVDVNRFSAAASRLRQAESTIISDEDTRCIAGRVAGGYALVLETQATTFLSSALLDRVHKACVLLTRMVTGESASDTPNWPTGGDDGSGAPAEVGIDISKRKRPN